jgi:hypothetical protein
MVNTMSQPNIFELSGVVARSEGSSKLALPVNPSVVLYARYKHVRGALPSQDASGVPLSKLRALDNLIERLIRIHGKQPIVRHIEDLTREEVDGLIANYSKGVHRIATDPRQSLTVGSASNDVALMVNLVA